MNDAEVDKAKNTRGELGLVTWHDYVCNEPYTFERGGTLPGFTLRYETYGKLNTGRNNAILVTHALSGDHHCAGVHDLKDRKTGWWNHFIGPGKPLDTTKYFVVCANCIGGCAGSTGPRSINPDTGKPWNMDFPDITIRDMVRTQRKLLDHLGIPRLYAVVGGSMGGMQALQWAIEYPGYIDCIIPMACTARANTQAIAFNEVGRNAIVNDPAWQDGDYPDKGGPKVGLAIARMMAHITYLSDIGLEQKFGRDKRINPPNHKLDLLDVEFEIESYLRYQGASFVNRFDANTYLYFTKALDRFDLYGANNDLDATLANVTARTLMVGFSTDWLYPPQQNREIVHSLLRNRKHATYAEIKMDYGHDSFLVDAPQLFDLVHAFLDEEPS